MPARPLIARTALVAYGSSGIVDPDGMVVQSARQMKDLIVAEIEQ